MIDHTLVLAAGLGSRIRSVAKDLPKPLLPFGPRPVLLHNLLWLQQHGIRSAWINLHYGADQIKAAVDACAALDMAVSFSYEPELLGTAGAVANIAAFRGNRTLVVYGDNVLGFDLQAMVDEHLKHKAAITIALFDPKQHANTGIAGGRVFLRADGQVDRFVEGANLSEGLVNAGVYIVEPSVIETIPTQRLVDFGRDVFPQLVLDGCRLQGFVMDKNGYCLGLDTPESLAEGLSLLEQGKVVLP